MPFSRLPVGILRVLARPSAAVILAALSVPSSTVFAARRAVLLTPSESGEYTVTDLGTLGGAASVATGINQSGQIVGWSYTSGFTTPHAFLYTAESGMVDLGTLGGANSHANAINDQNIIAGGSLIAGTDAYGAFRCTGSDMTALPAPEGSISTANGINHLGHIAGWHRPADSPFSQAFLYTGATMIELGTLGGPMSEALAINGSSQVAGASSIDDSHRVHAFLWSSGATGGPASNPQMVDLGTLGGSTSAAFGINNHGHVVGDAAVSGDEVWHAFLYDGASMVDLGTLGGDNSTARAINNNGVIVGESEAPPGQMRAFLHNGTEMIDLNDLVTERPGWTLVSATGINDAGQIIGVADLITPVWHARGGGSFNDPANWAENRIPDGANGDASFYNAITATAMVTVDAPVTLRTISIDSRQSYTIAGPGVILLDASGDSASVNVFSGQHTISATLSLVGDTVFNVESPGSRLTVSGEVLTSDMVIYKNGKGTVEFGRLSGPQLRISEGVVKLLPSPDGSANRLGLVLVSPDGQLDLTNGALIVDETPMLAIEVFIQMGRNGGDWQGPGIVSSFATADSTMGIAAILNDTGNGTPIYNAFRGHAVTSSSILVAYTWNGDADLSGVIDADDYFRIDQGFLRGLPGYRNGDFDYNGIVDADDYHLIDAAFLAQAGHAPAFLSSVPEPGALAILPVAMLILSGRRRRARR